MMKHQFGKVLGILALTGVFVAGGFAACSHHHRSPEKRAEWITSKISGKLDLNDEQEKKLDAVKETMLEIRKSHKSHSADRAKHLGEVKQMILSERLDSAKAKSMMTERQKFMNRNFDKVFAKVAEFHASLTPEQKQKAVEMLEKFSKHWE